MSVESGENNSSGDELKMNETFSLVYEQLRRIASNVRRNERSGTLNSTALVNEAWIKLRKSPSVADTSPTHFRAISGRAMRQVLVEYARRRAARKRAATVVQLDEVRAGVSALDIDLLDLDDALKELKLLDARQAEVVVNRFFGGMSAAEIAAAMNISEATVERLWRAARAWLTTRIQIVKHAGELE